MRSENPLNSLSAQQRAVLMEAARVRAIELRDEAIDDVWRGACAALQRSLHGGASGMMRSTQRLQARLARHWLARQTGQLEG